jgi:hypothetical protein
VSRLTRSPWWFCTGWWSPWCLIDAIAHCKVPWICRKHDAAQHRWFDKRYGKADADYDWTEDDSLDRDTLHALMDGLPQVEVEGKPRVVLTSTWPLTTIATTGSTATVTWREDGTQDWRWS